MDILTVFRPYRGVSGEGIGAASTGGDGPASPDPANLAVLRVTVRAAEIAVSGICACACVRVCVCVYPTVVHATFACLWCIAPTHHHGAALDSRVRALLCSNREEPCSERLAIPW